MGSEMCIRDRCGAHLDMLWGGESSRTTSRVMVSVGTTTYPMLVTFGGLTSLLSREPVLSHVVEDALTRRTPTLDLQVAASARPAVAALLGRSLDGSGRLPVLLVTSTFREAEESAATLKTWLGADSVCYYPSWETLPHERLSPRTDTVGRRMEVLRRLCGCLLYTSPSPRDS